LAGLIGCALWGRLAGAILVSLLASACALTPAQAPSPTAGSEPPVASNAAEQATSAPHPTRGRPTSAAELAAQLVLDIDAALEIERTTADDTAFTTAIRAWYASERDYLTSNQPVWASDDGFAQLGHEMLVIESALDGSDALLLREFVRELDYARADLEAIR
jgi:hypothetical protein